MATKYAFKPANSSNPNAVTESWDLVWLQNLRDTYTDINGNLVGGEIKAINVDFFVTNDPESLTFPTFEEAAQRRDSLQQDTYQVDEYASLIVPQPEGLND